MWGSKEDYCENHLCRDQRERDADALLLQSPYNCPRPKGVRRRSSEPEGRVSRQPRIKRRHRDLCPIYRDSTPSRAFQYGSLERPPTKPTAICQWYADTRLNEALGTNLVYLSV